MVNVIVRVAVAGTPVPSLDKERAGTCVSECHTRKATPAEMRRYFSLAEKSEQGKPVSPTAGVPEETREVRREMSEKLAMGRLINAAREVDEHKYKALKAAVMIIEKVNGWA